jgi:hypothetical protein
MMRFKMSCSSVFSIQCGVLLLVRKNAGVLTEFDPKKAKAQLLSQIPLAFHKPKG